MFLDGDLTRNYFYYSPVEVSLQCAMRSSPFGLIRDLDGFLRCSTLMLAHLHCKARKQRAKLCSCILQRVWKGVSKILRSQTSVVAHSQEFLCLYAPDANLHTTIFYSQLGLRYLKQPHKLVCVLVALVLSQSSIVCQIVGHMHSLL